VIWDELLIHGRKIIFKTGLLVLSELEDKLNFEHIMLILGSMSLHPIFKQQGFTHKLKVGMKDIKVTNTMLSQLEKEYTENLIELREYFDNSLDC